MRRAQLLAEIDAVTEQFTDFHSLRKGLAARKSWGRSTASYCVGVNVPLRLLFEKSAFAFYNMKLRLRSLQA
jgi:hypothetical protein